MPGKRVEVGSSEVVPKASSVEDGLRMEIVRF